ncbi:echotoxin-2-like [Mytilus californianus]|uniref:echotoxin-2-like n=1 Tax=Mytilus californianus TaxID=6549 RepID=UPI0022474670|nr:echotoxin-2-like [Mytilus californianus]
MSKPISRRRKTRFSESEDVQTNDPSDGKNHERVDWKQLKQKLKAATTQGNSFRSSIMYSKENYIRVCTIYIQNWTTIELSKPNATINTGCLASPPQNVGTKMKEVMVGHKVGFSLRGTSGIVSWLVGNLDRRVIVMCNVPFFSSSNNLAVGITSRGVKNHTGNWYESISRNDTRDNICYTKGVFHDQCNQIISEDDILEVLGDMGTGSRADVIITVRPKNRKFLPIN